LLRAKLLHDVPHEGRGETARQLRLAFFSWNDSNTLGALPPNPRSLSHGDTD
jgi:hypothetical protein